MWRRGGGLEQQVSNHTSNPAENTDEKKEGEATISRPTSAQLGRQRRNKMRIVHDSLS